MNTEFRSPSRILRAGLAVAAALVSFFVVGATLSLAEHYSVNAQLAAATQPSLAMPGVQLNS